MVQPLNSALKKKSVIFALEDSWDHVWKTNLYILVTEEDGFISKTVFTLKIQ
jgi:hypothetical protein